MTREQMHEAALLAASDIYAALADTKDNAGDYMTEYDFAEIIENRMIDESQ